MVEQTLAFIGAGLSLFRPLLILAVVGTLNPSSGDASVFLPLEHARMAAAAQGSARTVLFARYSLAGALRAAPGALAAAMPDRQIRHFLRVFTLAERVSVLANGEVIRVFPPELTEMQRRVLGLLGVPASAYLAMP